ncbi:MAG: T9SS type A sorting domain-containing protein [Flavobacteriales bacterium]|nr:T9SS type A sorting domain-containing protein [Flavobacteriales bacterium]
MKRSVYTTSGLLAVLCSTTLVAQQADRTAVRQMIGQPCESIPSTSEVRPVEDIARGGGDVVWSEDFSNGFAGSNPSGAWTADGESGDIWRVNSNAPRGAYTQNAERIQSTTFANGFAKFASDSANCTWSGSTPTALDPDLFIAWDGSFVSPIIDLSATPLVELEFQQRSRYCCGDSPFFLEISTDGGETWPTVILANEGLPFNQGAPGTNTPPTTTETRTFNIAGAIAEDPSNVRFRFHHNGDANSSHYFWQIDDIKISTLPDYEMVMNYAYTSTTGTGEEYGRIPSSQLPATMNVGAELYNYGGQEQTNVVLTCSVTNEDDVEVFTSEAMVGTIASGDSVVTDEDALLPVGLPIGKYTATFTWTSDQVDQDLNPANNSRVRTFEVTEFVYSLDNIGGHPSGTQSTQQVGSGSFADNSENVKLMNMYFINSTMIATGIQLGLGSNSDPGSSIIVSLLDTADVLATPSVVNEPLAESDPHLLTQSEITAGVVNIPFFEAYELTPGAYYAVASLYSDGDAAVYILDDTTVPQPGLASALWIPFDPPNNQNFYGGNGTAWAVRLVSSPTIGIAERSDLEGVTLFPNPTSGELRITTTSNENYTVEVLNVLGERVMADRFFGNTAMDLSGVAKGVYSVRVSNGTSTTVERVTLN